MKRICNMVTKLDKQLEEYDARVGSSLQLIACDATGRIPIRDLSKALSMIRHRPEEDVVAHVVDKLDVDHDGYRNTTIKCVPKSQKVRGILACRVSRRVDECRGIVDHVQRCECRVST